MKKISNITVVIVTFKSINIIEKCLKNLRLFNKILILDNSNERKIKNLVKKKFKNTKVFLSKNNLGYAAGNNFLLRKVKTKYALIINPDVTIQKKSIIKLKNFIEIFNNDFAIIGNSKDAKKEKLIKYKKVKYYLCKFVRGYFMLVNMKILKKINFFDKNFFMYLEEIDLCFQVKKLGFKVLALDNLKIKHLGGKSSKIGTEFEKNRNWHWMWSQFYFHKKYSNYLLSFFKFFPKLIIHILKFIFFFFFKKNNFYYYRFSGLISAMLCLKSYYRPKLK